MKENQYDGKGKTQKKINKIKSSFSEKANKINQSIARLTKKKKKKTNYHNQECTSLTLEKLKGL